MKVLVYSGPLDIRIKEVEKPKPGPGEVCVKVKAVSICGSDLSGYRGKNAMRVAPLVMGHEFAGEIVELGENVHDVPIGMRVTVNPNVYCGKCPNCLAGRMNVCEFRRIVGTTMTRGSYDGAMAEYVCVPQMTIIPLPDNVSYEEGAVVEPLAVSLHGAKKAGNVKGQVVAVIGAGPIGLLAVQCLKALGAKTVIATDIVDDRLAMARKCGADYVFNTRNDDLKQKVTEITNGAGAAAVFDAVGIHDSLNQAIDVVANGGNVIGVGMGAPVTEFEFKKLITHEINLLGSYTYTTEMQEAVELLREGKLKVKEMITTVAPLEKGPEVFADLVSGNSHDIKVILRP